MKSTTLLIMRHAKSGWNHEIQDDFNRQLTPRGQREAEKMGRWIEEQGYLPNKLIASPARRVQETIQFAASPWPSINQQVNWDEKLYNASLNYLLAVISADLVAKKTNLLIAHNPGLYELVLYLCGHRLPSMIGSDLMSTADIAVFKLNDPEQNTDSIAWQLIEYVTPSALY